MKKVKIASFIVALGIAVVISNYISMGEVVADSDIITTGATGDIKTEKRDLKGFDSVEVGGVFDVEIVAQKDFEVIVEADEEVLSKIITEVKGKTLTIKRKDHDNWKFWKHFSRKGKMRVKISAPSIRRLEASGASNVSLRNVNNDLLTLDVSGASDVTVEGTARKLNADLSGASDLLAKNLKTQSVTIEGSGASSAKIYVSGSLTVDLSGASSVRYSGNPETVKKHTSGASSVRKS